MKKSKIQKQQTSALLLATFILTINFWAWSLLGPLAPNYEDMFSLSPFEVSLLVAIPIVVGAFGRIILGGIADRFGGKKALTTVCLLSVIPIIGLSAAGSYNQLLFFGFLLGMSGAVFSAGIPFVNAWFPASKRGFALGVYGMGNLGVAVSGFLTPRIAEAFGIKWSFYVVAALLVVTGALTNIYLKESRTWRPSKTPFISSLHKSLKLRVSQDLALIYALTFGAFVAFGLYLPVLLKNTYFLSLTDAASRAAGFVIIATLARPIGGWLSDRWGGQNIIRLALFGAAILSALIAFQKPLGAIVTAQYLSLAFVLGCGNGAVFALVSKLSPPTMLGSISGIVGAAGGLGGLLPPMIMGLSFQHTGSYSLAIALLSITTILVFLYTSSRFRNIAFK